MMVKLIFCLESVLKLFLFFKSINFTLYKNSSCLLMFILHCYIFVEFKEKFVANGFEFRLTISFKVVNSISKNFEVL